MVRMRGSIGYGLRKLWPAFLFFLAIIIGSFNSCAARPTKQNLLFFLGESVRPNDVEIYGGPESVASNFNRIFARPGTIFVEQMHVSYPMCNPSRTTILLGRRPDTTGVKTNFLNWKKHPDSANWVSLPRLLKDNGWYTTTGGKVFHRGTNDDTAWMKMYDSSEDINELECHKDPESKPVPLTRTMSMPNIMACKTTANNLPDLQIAKKAVAELDKIGKDPGSYLPFAMFVGFQLPHYPIRVHNKYLVDRKIVQPRVPTEEPPRDQSQFKNDLSFDSPKPKTNSKDTRDNDPYRSQIPRQVYGGNAFSGPGATKYVRENMLWIQLSAVKQMDAAAGQIFDALDRNGFYNDTLIVFVSDHSVGLGETRLFEKDIPMDIATRVPFMIHVPWMGTPLASTGPDFFMDGVDVYRTIAELMGVSSMVAPAVEGRDFSGYILSAAASKQLGRPLGKSPSHAAFSQVSRCSNIRKCYWDMKGMDMIGYTVRTKQYRYTAYVPALDGNATSWSYDRVVSEELYDHSNDPSTIYNPNGLTYVGHEMTNLAYTSPELAKFMFNVLEARYVRLDYSEDVLGDPTFSPTPSPTKVQTEQPTVPGTKAPSTHFPSKRPTLRPTSITESPTQTTSPSSSAPTVRDETSSPTPTIDTMVPSSGPTPVPSPISKDPNTNQPTTARPTRTHSPTTETMDPEPLSPPGNSEQTSSSSAVGLAILAVPLTIGLVLLVLFVLRSQRRDKNWRGGGGDHSSAANVTKPAASHKQQDMPAVEVESQDDFALEDENQENRSTSVSSPERGQSASADDLEAKLEETQTTLQTLANV